MLSSFPVASSSTVAAENRTPNIVVILADDLGYGDLGCYGGKIPTPCLDRFAANGIRFTDAHSGSSVCSPTRYGLLTGRYAWRSKLKQGVLGGLSPRLIESNRMTVAAMLQSHGYHTACIGKWHLGMDWEMIPGKEVTEMGIESRGQVFNVDYSRPIRNGPNSLGFDYFYGISASLDMVPYTFIRDNRVVDFPSEDRDFLMFHGRDKGGKTRRGPTAPNFEADAVLPTLTQKSIEYIDSRATEARNGKPFFLYLPLASPHTPILPTSQWLGKSGINAYADFVMQTDAAIGEVLESLERNQLTADTLVIITSDNGCSDQAKFTELESKGHFPSGPLRGHKADIFEGGHRVPFLVRWPNGAASGDISDKLVCLTDLMATFAEINGKPLPENAAEDSFSFLSSIRKQSSDRSVSESSWPVREHLVSHSINGSFAIRQGDWKLALCRDSGGWSEPRPGSQAAVSLPAVQLYNLAKDLRETDNLYATEPNKCLELDALLERVANDGRSTPGPKQPNTTPVNIRLGMPGAK